METMTVQHLVDLGVTDHYTDALHKVIAAMAEHREPAPADGKEKAAALVVDLMAALEASVAKAKEARGEAADDAPVHEIPTKKAAAAKKAPAKKTAAKKPTSRRRKSA